MTNSPFFSVILNTYNAKKTIKNTVSSILNQSFQNFELIVVDDNSTDGTVELLKKYLIDCKVKLKLITLKVNSGIAHSRNVGVNMANGKYVAFIDSDCIATKEWLQSILEKVSLTDRNVAGIGGKILNGIDSWIGNAGYFSEFYGCFDEKSRFTRMSPTANLCLKKDVLDKVGYFDESLRTSQDTDLCWRIVKNGYKILYDSDIVVTHFGVSTFSEFWNKQMSLGKGFIMTRKKHNDIPPIKIPENVFVFGFMIPFLYVASLMVIFKKTITVFGFKVIHYLPLILIGRIGYWIGALKSFKTESYS